MSCIQRLRLSIALISAAQTLVIISYFACGVHSGPTVSSMLFSLPAYRSLLMICVVLQLTLSFAYICVKRASVVPESLLVAALAAWIVLNSVYEDGNGKLMLEHLIAAGCFIAAAGLYLIWVFVEAVYNEPLTSDLMCVSGFCIIGALIATIATVVCFFADSVDTWVFEHTAFALFSATHALLFSIGSQKGA